MMKLLGWLIGMSGLLILAGCATEGTVSTGVYYYEPVYIGPPAIWYAPYYPYYHHRHNPPPVYHRHEIVRPVPPHGAPTAPPPPRVQPPPPRQSPMTPPSRPAPTPRGPQRTK